MSGQHIGYIRVSSVDQNPDRQLNDVHLDKRFIEKQSGKSTKERKVWAECCDYMREGDTLHIHSLDRLARNIRDLIFIVEELTGSGVKIISHKETLTFTQEENDPMSKFLFHIMGAVAEFERALIRERQKEGIAAAKARGFKFGRPKALSDEDWQEAEYRIASGWPISHIARHLGVSRQLIYRYQKEKINKQNTKNGDTKNEITRMERST